jgi:hypothetical protein
LANRSPGEDRGLLRREFLWRGGRLGILWPLAALADTALFRLCASACSPLAAGSQIAAQLSPPDDAFLEELERACFLFFWEQADPSSGLVKDRSRANGDDSRPVASIAATGFGMTALTLAHHRGWGAPDKIQERARNTLRFLRGDLFQERGFFYHFVDWRSGRRMWDCEISSIDTSILLCGVLSCGAYFEDQEIRKLAREIYDRVDWTWMLNGGETLSHGWKPETGFLKFRWDSYCELMMIYLLGLGSSSHPLEPRTWDAWSRPQFEYGSARYIGSKAPLFVHQFSHAWFDFRLRRDRYADYFANSIIATRVHKAWCLDLAKKFPDYSEDLWGISASDSAHGYVAWGGPPPMGPLDGTVVPGAAAGSLPFLPRDTLRVLRTIRDRFGKSAWRRYGFVDAFNSLTNWYDPDVVGIDVGITLLMAENLRSGFIWENFMKNEAAQRGMDRAGFRPDGPPQ